MTTQHAAETAAAENAIAAAAAEAAAAEPGAKYAIHPVTVVDGQPDVGDPVGETEPMSPAAILGVLNLLATQARAGIPADQREASDNRTAISKDLLLYGHAYHDEDGKRVDPATVTTRVAQDGTADGFLVADPAGREELRERMLHALTADMPADMAALLRRPSATTYENPAEESDRRWEELNAPGGRIAAALAEITADLRADGILADDEHLTYVTV